MFVNLHGHNDTANGLKSCLNPLLLSWICVTARYTKK
jgi:hypothetical protein